MLNNKSCFVLGLVILITVQSSAFAQPNRRKGRNEDESQKGRLPDLPSDPKLLKIHKEFADEAMKIAREYERDRDFDSAMAVYGQVLRLIPQHSDARSKLSLLKEREKQADRIVMKVDAAKTWQTTGIRVMADKPIQILSKGSWTFTLKRKLDPNGMAIPKELKDFNLGCLVGVIDTGNGTERKPFVIGTKKEIIPKQSGVLYLQMYDVDVSDNEGEIDVQITGTFERVTRGSKN